MKSGVERDETQVMKKVSYRYPLAGPAVYDFTLTASGDFLSSADLYGQGKRFRAQSIL